MIDKQDNKTDYSRAYGLFQLARLQLGKKIIGQNHLTDRLLISLLSDGHLLVEGAPGLAKTRAVKSVSQLIEGNFHRIQFTPDLLPADLTGTDIYQPESGSFHFQKGPLFHNIILADEINRAPAKVQSALLEAMAERQITIGRTTHPLPPLFMVMATQNPIEQEGTYPLPEAQLDRFLLHVKVEYPDSKSEMEVLRLARAEALTEREKTEVHEPQLTSDVIFNARNEVLSLHLSEQVERYIVELILATRDPSRYGNDFANWIEYGASPRGTIGLERVARAYAWLNGNNYVSPGDVQNVIYDVLRHRIIMSFEAEAEGFTADDFITKLIEAVPAP